MTRAPDGSAIDGGIGDVLWLDAVDQAALIESGAISARELVEAAVRRCEAVNPTLNAVIHPAFERALDRADQPPADAPLAGVPMLIKDLICREDGQPFHEGSRFLKQLGWTSNGNQDLAVRFGEAGLISIGRTNTPEFGMHPRCEPVAYGPTNNPWDLTRSPGGSSGGSAAAVAAGIVPVAHGNDVGGSIRNPASSCGLFGLKPSRGRSPMGPDFGDALGGLAEEGVLTRSVRDTAAVLDAVWGPAVGGWYRTPVPARPLSDEVGLDPGRLRVGVARAYPIDVHAGVVAAVDDMAELLAALGHGVEWAQPDVLFESEGRDVALTHYAAGTAWMVDHYWPRTTGREIPPELLEPTTLELAELGRSITGAQLLEARELAQAWTRRLVSWWEVDGFDVLLLPVLPDPPVVTGEGKDGRLVAFTAPFNLSGLPAASVPGLRWEGLPVGVQFVAGPFREDVILRLAAQVESARPWVVRPPVD